MTAMPDYIEWDDGEVVSERAVVCPYCKREHIDDLYEFGEGLHEFGCDECEKAFGLAVSFSVSYKSMRIEERHLLRLIAGEDDKPTGAVCVRCRRIAWFDSDGGDCGESDADMTRRLGERCAGAPELTITLTHDDCNVLMHGLMPVDQILYTGDGETVPPSEDTPEMRQVRERYMDLMDRIIDVGVGRGGDNDDSDDA